MKRIEVIPAVVPREVSQTVGLLSVIRRFTDVVQIDVGDGVFTKHRTLCREKIPDQELVGLHIEVHLMVEDIATEVKKWMNIQPKRIIMHVESKPTAQLIQMIKGKGIEPVIGLKAETDISLLSPYAHLVDTFLFLSISPPGEQGRPFIHEVLEKIRVFHKKYPALTIECDGGINELTMIPLLKHGVTRFVMGSGLFSAERPAIEQYTIIKAKLREQSLSV